MSREELVRTYDAISQSTQVGLDFYRSEIARRDSEEVTKTMLALTRQMRNMTVAVVLLTILNFVLVAVSFVPK
jgi:hypothetical protein